MDYRSAAVAAIGAVLLALSGCATKPQTPIGFNVNGLTTDKPTVGIAMTALPKPEVHLPGASCLLCIITAQAGNGTLSKYTGSLGTEDLPQLKQRLAATLAKRGVAVKVIPEPLDVRAFPDSDSREPGFSKKNFASIKQKYGVDKLLVVEIEQVGFERTYSAYIPTSDPKGLFRGKGYVVDLRTNRLDWYQQVDVRKSADGQWDEPERFPGLTNAYFQALEIGQDGLLRPLAN